MEDRNIRNSSPAKLTALNGPNTPISVTVSTVEGRMVTAQSAATMTPGVTVRIDEGDAMLLGEVVAVKEEAPGRFTLMIELRESLSGLNNIRRLVGALMGTARAGDPVHPLPDEMTRPMVIRPREERKQR